MEVLLQPECLLWWFELGKVLDYKGLFQYSGGVMVVVVFGWVFDDE